MIFSVTTRKGIFLLIFILAIVSASLLYSQYIQEQLPDGEVQEEMNEAPKEQEELPVEVPIENTEKDQLNDEWQLYANEQDQYSMEYPNTWVASEATHGTCGPVFSPSGDIFGDQIISICIFGEDGAISDHADMLIGDNEELDRQEIIVAGYDSLQIAFITSSGGEARYQTETLIGKQLNHISPPTEAADRTISYSYFDIYTYFPQELSYEENIKIYTSMVNSFRFIGAE